MAKTTKGAGVGSVPVGPKPRSSKNAPETQTIGESIIADMIQLRDALASGTLSAQTGSARRWQVDAGPETFSAEEILAIRNLTGASQPLFGRFLGVKAGTLRSWELGRIKPSKPAVRLLDEIRRNPDYFRRRLMEMVKPG